MRVLSIDFDYFLNTTLEVRNELFPDAEDITDPKEIKEMWNTCYLNSSIDTIGVINDYLDMISFLERHKKVPYLVAESHKDIYEFIKEQQNGSDTVLEIVNVDFHHDNYYMYGGKVTCANWLMKVCEETNTDNVLWIKRRDSETVSLAGEFPYHMTDDITECFEKEYDCIFLCMSPEWTPPHLREHFNRMADCLR